MKHFKLVLFSFLFISIFFLVACDDTSDCRYLENRKVKLNFAKNNKALTDTTIKFLSVYVPAMNNKELYDSISSETLNLSLSQNSDTSVFIVKIKKIYDTLIFISTRRLEMISSECGFNTRFYVDSLAYTKNNIVRIDQLDANIDKEILKNYVIVVKPAPFSSDTVKLK